MPLIRVVVAGSGDDGHGRAAGDAVARALRDAGMEVVRTRDATPVAVVRTVVQEDAAAVCVTETALADEVRDGLAAQGLADVVVVAAPPADDVAAVITRALGHRP